MLHGCVLAVVAVLHSPRDACTDACYEPFFVAATHLLFPHRFGAGPQDKAQLLAVHVTEFQEAVLGGAFGKMWQLEGLSADRGVLGGCQAQAAAAQQGSAAACPASSSLQGPEVKPRQCFCQQPLQYQRLRACGG